MFGKMVGYISGNFIYEEKLKTKLDELKLKYYKDDSLTPEQYVEEIRIYCEKYNEWPKHSNKKKKKKANIKTGYQLAIWLNHSGYSGKFKYGEELKNKLDELKSKYYKSKKKFDKYWLLSRV